MGGGLAAEGCGPAKATLALAVDSNKIEVAAWGRAIFIPRSPRGGEEKRVGKHLEVSPGWYLIPASDMGGGVVVTSKGF